MDFLMGKIFFGRVGSSSSVLSFCCFLAVLFLLALSAQNAGAQGFYNGGARRLPPVNMDSFVQQAGGAAEAIYGDEGVGGREKNGASLPPYDGFGASHRIDAGIFGARDAGLTTGHGSNMPSAWGADEYLAGEWASTGSGHFEEYQSPELQSYENSQRLGAGSASASDMSKYTGFP